MYSLIESGKAFKNVEKMFLQLITSRGKQKWMQVWAKPCCITLIWYMVKFWSLLSTLALKETGTNTVFNRLCIENENTLVTISIVLNAPMFKSSAEIYWQYWNLNTVHAFAHQLTTVEPKLFPFHFNKEVGAEIKINPRDVRVVLLEFK